MIDISDNLFDRSTMTKTIKKYENFARVAVRPEVKREIDVLAAMSQRPVYELVADMVANYKITSIVELPHPADAKAVPVISLSRR